MTIARTILACSATLYLLLLLQHHSTATPLLLLFLMTDWDTLTCGLARAG